MTAAVVALAIALAAAIGGLITLAVKAIGAERRCGDARADESALAVRFENMTAQRDTESQRADHEKERADALDDLFASGAVGSHKWDELLQKWRALHPVAATRGGAPGPVPAPPAAPHPGPDDLLPLE